MRAMGENPTEDDVLNLMMEADLDGSGTIEFPGKYSEYFTRQKNADLWTQVCF